MFPTMRAKGPPGGVEDRTQLAPEGPGVSPVSSVPRVRRHLKIARVTSRYATAARDAK